MVKKKVQKSQVFHRDNGGALGMVPLIFNPIYTLCIVGIYCVYHPF